MRTLFLTLLLVSVCAISELKPISDYNMEYYREVFPEAALKEEVTMPDGISEEAINTTYLRIFNDAQEPLGFIREVYTTPGCSTLCKPLDFTLAISKTGEFEKLLVREPLTKKAHRKFKTEDYEMLHNILLNPPESFENAATPSDLVDEVTRATKKAYKKDVVKGAALTCFRAHQYVQETVAFIKKDPIVTEFRAEVGQKVPAFTLPNAKGGNITFDYATPKYKGKITILTFFSTWCHYCKLEMPQLKKLYEKYNSNGSVEFLAIRTFRNKESETIENFIERFGINFPLVSDNPKELPPYSRVAKMYNIRWVPTNMVIDKTGKLHSIPELESFDNFVQEMSKIIDELL